MATERNGMIDYGRFLAALGVVWFFSQAPGGRIVYVSLPFLLVILSTPIATSLSTRVTSLLRPFLIWSLIFAVVQMAFALKNHAPVLGWWDWHMLLVGTWSHLWILPFAFLASVLAPWFQHPLASLGTALLVAVLMAVRGTPETIPFGLWSFGIIPVLVGIAFVSWGWRLAVVTLVCVSLVLHFGRPSPDNITIVAGTALALAFMTWRLPATAVSDWCARMSVWIFLAHPLVIIVGQSLRITWVELGLFSLVGSTILAQILDLTLRNSRREVLELS